ARAGDRDLLLERLLLRLGRGLLFLALRRRGSLLRPRRGKRHAQQDPDRQGQQSGQPPVIGDFRQRWACHRPSPPKTQLGVSRRLGGRRFKDLAPQRSWRYVTTA